MTKEELYSLADGSINFHDAEEVIPIKYLDEFFSQNVVIKRGENRHSQADVWHEYLEDTTKKLEALEYGVWKESGLNSGIPYRIKPQELVYEALVRINYSDGTYDDTERFFTYQEFIDFGFPKSCEWAEETKRVRQ